MQNARSTIDNLLTDSGGPNAEQVSEKVYRVDSGNDFLEWREGKWKHMYWDPDIARAYPEAFDSNCRNLLIDHFRLDPMDPHLNDLEFMPPDALKYRAEQMDKGD